MITKCYKVAKGWLGQALLDVLPSLNPAPAGNFQKLFLLSCASVDLYLRKLDTTLA